MVLVIKQCVKFDLPWPPTVNTYWRMYEGRMLISKAGREYRNIVCGELVQQSKVSGELAVDIVACPPDRRRRDIDNLLKSLLDAMQEAGMYDDDSQIADLRIRRGEVIAGGRVTVELQEI